MMNTGGITNAVRRLSSSTSVGKLKPENTVFLLCDIQDRFRPLTWRGETIINTAKYMTSVAKELDIPIVITQQYTKVFGETVKDTFADQEHFASCKIFEKKRFSMCTDEVKSHMQTLNRDSVVVSSNVFYIKHGYHTSLMHTTCIIVLTKEIKCYFLRYFLLLRYSASRHMYVCNRRAWIC